jgi:hypothetical protein
MQVVSNRKTVMVSDGNDEATKFERENEGKNIL